MNLNIISCPKCKKDYLVGINGKDIRKEKFDGGSVDKIPFILVGMAEVESTKPLPKKVKCKNCGTVCKVRESKPVNKWTGDKFKPKKNGYSTKDAGKL